MKGFIKIESKFKHSDIAATKQLIKLDVSLINLTNSITEYKVGSKLYFSFIEDLNDQVSIDFISKNSNIGQNIEREIINLGIYEKK